MQVCIIGLTFYKSRALRPTRFVLQQQQGPYMLRRGDRPGDVITFLGTLPLVRKHDRLVSNSVPGSNAGRWKLLAMERFAGLHNIGGHVVCCSINVDV
jgi:hypothetical protein